MVQKLHENASAGAKAIRLEKQEKIQPARRINRVRYFSTCVIIDAMEDWLGTFYKIRL